MQNILIDLCKELNNLLHYLDMLIFISFFGGYFNFEVITKLKVILKFHKTNFAFMTGITPN